MKHSKTYNLFVLFLAIIFCSNFTFIFSSLAEDNRTETEIYSTQDVIFTKSTFSVQGDINKIFPAIFDYKHLKEYIIDVNKIELLNSGENYPIIKYYAQFLFYKYNFVYKRELRDNGRLIVFNLIKGATLSIPFIKDSGGFYKIYQKDKEVVIQYVCWVKLSFLPRIIAKDLVKRKTDAYIDSLSRYLNAL